MNLSSSALSSSSVLPLSNKRLSLSSRPARVSVISCSSNSSTTMKIGGKTSCNFYKLLSLSSEAATMTEIKQAYKSMALRYHPDVCRDAAAKEEWTRVFVQLNAAYETLSNPQLREEYDYKVLGLRRAAAAAAASLEISDEIRLRKSRCEGQKRRSNKSSLRTQRMKHRN
ncbi:chaperone protein dnaJ 20, chloroplastic-like [Prosopis cineraria]|uniref:chaperone protein dnaJ 20, chloroplastic-like n=1 Tax=Prosopis cineraria TaxID=364024 RepID=UPI00240EE11B|nr:chaperone protein dnaJ 20, chloroplastic-like [Prosopis cineraria]